MTQKIVYQGEHGANSHTACMNVYPGFTAVPCPTFEDCFAAVETGEAALAMIPLENSIAGRVADIHILLPHSSLAIIGEYFLPIRFDLLALPGTVLSDLKTAESHVMALGQCRGTLRKMNLRAVIAADTAGAARAVSESNDKSRAALAPKLAGEIYGLVTLQDNCQDAAHNTTRFIVLSPTPQAPICTGACITTLIFRVRNISSALYKALGVFAHNAINMTKLESYMVDGGFAATMFYVDVEGRPDAPELAQALDELRVYTDDIRVLGTYPAHAFRQKTV